MKDTNRRIVKRIIRDLRMSKPNERQEAIILAILELRLVLDSEETP